MNDPSRIWQIPADVEVSSPQLPTHFDLGPHRYEVRTDPDTAMQLRADGSKGDCLKDDHIIRVDPDQTPAGLVETLWHEALHAAWHQSGLHHVAEDGAEEQIVAALALRTLELVRRNPNLAALLVPPLCTVKQSSVHFDFDAGQQP